MLRGRWNSKLDWKWMVASAVLLALPAGPASANLDLNETAAALALPLQLLLLPRKVPYRQFLRHRRRCLLLLHLHNVPKM